MEDFGRVDNLVDLSEIVCRWREEKRKVRYCDASTWSAARAALG